MTPSAISHQIKSLEEFLGVKLFRRERRQVSLTVAGERYLPSIQLALDEVESATRRLMTSPNLSAVNISVAPAFLTRWLVPRITRFQALYPDVELRFSATTGYVDFEHSDTDMAVYYGEGNWRGVDIHFLRNLASTPVCSPALMEGEAGLKEPKDLLNKTLIHVSGRRQEWQQILQQLGVRATGLNRTMSFSSTALAVSAAIEGIGLALADRALIQRELEAGQLVIPFDITLDKPKAFYLVYQEKRQLTYAMQAFRDWMLQEMQQDLM
ncbi:LysR family glycine cleavage system transcriptional activator [Marinobacterium halophilum]|uniref:LysR family glycine cleavage system transcriptional activator n=1 Tax=Marinobacterium halophilum TaxID=267374 RepID=A0A2P8ES18_9GAMM|nr:LysR family glycine cleavage system transcriptional activator [Marinobacterium halophilum]